MRVRRHPSPARQHGFSLIEVLVAALMVSIGLLGAAGMHLRAIEYTVDTERRQMAAMVASELLETMRGDTAIVLLASGDPKADLGGYKKEAGTALPGSEDADCQPLTSNPEKRLGCWGARAKQVIPELTDDLITSHFAVDLDATSQLISVTVTWPVKKGQCLDGKDNDYCTYTLRSRL
ncbi:MAG: type IV pilus modification protein PilV [Variovorax sp.]|nr:MAG: type IV pilus modification protein PilV [Variovorax sp.]